MSDLDRLDELIGRAICDSARDPQAADDLHACLISGLGLAIAFHAGGNTDLASQYCDRASIQIYEQATAQAGVLADLARSA